MLRFRIQIVRSSYGWLVWRKEGIHCDVRVCNLPTNKVPTFELWIVVDDFFGVSKDVDKEVEVVDVELLSSIYPIRLLTTDKSCLDKGYRFGCLVLTLRGLQRSILLCLPIPIVFLGTHWVKKGLSPSL